MLLFVSNMARHMADFDGLSGRSFVSIVHYSEAGNHFGFLNLLVHMETFQGWQKSWSVKKYVDGCLQFQTHNWWNKIEYYSCGSRFSIYTEEEWGWTDPIVPFCSKRCSFSTISTWVDRLTRMIHFMHIIDMDTVIYMTNELFKNIFNYHSSPDNIRSDLFANFSI